MNAIDQHMFKVLTTTTLAVLLGGMIFYHHFEKFSWVNAYYFCVVTLTTVGYGDIVPKTNAGKIFTTFYILVGVGIITTFITTFVKRRAAKMRVKTEAKLK